MTKPARTIKTPKQRAEERLAVAQARANRTFRAMTQAEVAFQVACDDHNRSTSRLAHAKADPDLSELPTLPLGGEA